MIATVPHSQNYYLDEEVWVNLPIYNSRAWYFVKAEDAGGNASLPGNMIDFLALYHGQSSGSSKLLSITETPADFSLSASPNPFNPTTVISYELQDASYVNLAVYDLSGRKVAELVNGWREAGAHHVIFDGSNLTSGIYLYRLEASGSGATPTTALGKMVLMK